MNCSSLFHFLLFILSPSWAQMAPETCDGKQRQVTLNKEANIYLGVFLDASSSGEGLFGCGPYIRSGVAGFEALKWSLERVNKDFGDLGSRIVHDSYIPGVKFGMHVYDTCQQKERKVRGLGELFPVLREGPHNCSPFVNDTVLAMALLDLTGTTSSDREISRLLNQYNIPVVDSSLSVILTPSQRARILMGFMEHFPWKKVSLIMENEELSVKTAKVILDESRKKGICFDSIHIVPSPENAVHSLSFNDTPLLEGEEVNALYHKIVNTVKESKTNGVIVIVKQEATSRILKALLDEKKLISNWIFLDFFDESNSNLLKELLLNGNSLWAIQMHPFSTEEFETRWKNMHNISLKKSTETEWIVQFFEETNKCLMPDSLFSRDRPFQLEGTPPCRAISKKEDKIDEVMRNQQVVASIHGAFTIFNGIRSAWKSLCKNRRGLCPELQELSREDLMLKYLRPLKFDHMGPGSRSPKSMIGGKKEEDPIGTLSNPKVGLIHLSVDKNTKKTQVEEVLVFENDNVLKLPTSVLPSAENATHLSKDKCVGETCNQCIFDIESSSQTTGFSTIKVEIINTASPVLATEQHVYIPSEDDVIITGLFPIHKTSENGTDCSDQINPEGIQEMEAFLWAIRQINKHEKLLPKTQLGALVLDTCGSKIRATNQVTNLLKMALPGVNLDPSNIWAFVMSLETETAKVIGEMLASLNITSINLGISAAHSPYALQMKPPINLEAEAIVQIFRYHGWEFASVVVSSEDEESLAGSTALRTVANAARVCLTKEFKMTSHSSPDKRREGIENVLSGLKEKASQGARVVVLFLTPLDLRDFLERVYVSTKERRLNKNDFIFLSSSTFGDYVEKFQEFDEELGSVIALKDGQQDVNEFSTHFQLLQPKNNKQNPWFLKYWQQEFKCKDGTCPEPAVTPSVIPYHRTPATPRVVQALFSFGAAFTQLVSHLCLHAEGRMCPGLLRWRQRTVLNEFLRNTEVSRVDKPSEFFQFTENFHGNAPLDVLNLQRSLGYPVLQKQYEYKKIGRYVNSKLELSQAVGEYQNGTQISLSLLPSSCKLFCASCQHHDTDYLFLNSPDKLYVIATFDVHRPGLRPLECGLLDGDQGIQKVEAFLWALKLVNEDETILPGIKLGAIIFDACGSKEKVVRDVTNFLTGRIPEVLKPRLPSSANIVGLIAGGYGEAVRQVIDVSQPYGITTMATQASETALANSKRFPALLRLAPSNDLMARGMTSLLSFYGWEFFSVVYSDGGDSADTYKYLFRELKSIDMKMALAEPIPMDVGISEPDFIFTVWGKLAEAAQKGSRIVLLLLEPHHAHLFLQTASTLRQQQLLRPGDFVFITLGSPLPFIRDPADALGMLSMEPSTHLVPEFRSHFRKLSIHNLTVPYPWFYEFWSEVFECQGASCFSLPHFDLSVLPFRQAPGVMQTAEAVSLLARGLEIWRQEVCKGQEQNSCDSLISDPFYREKLFRFIRSVDSLGPTGKLPVFAVDGHNTDAAVEIFNFRLVGSSEVGLVSVGSYSDKKGLRMNSTQAFAYNSANEEIVMSEIKSSCIDFESCGNKREKIERTPGEVPETLELKKSKDGYEQMYPEQKFGISGIIPLHRHGNSFFSCGEFMNNGVFQNLVAVAYALNEINKNGAGIGLGAILFDYCSRTERAREQLFSFFSGEANENYNIILTPNRIVASLSFDDDAAEAVSSILSSNYVPHFSSPVAGQKLGDRKDFTIFSSVPSRSAELRMYVSILKAFNWKFVSVIFDASAEGRFLMNLLREYFQNENICIGDALGVPKRVSKEYAGELFETLASEWKPSVVLLLMDDSENIRTCLEVVKKMELGDRFVFLAGSAWGNHAHVAEGMGKTVAGALTFTLETYDIPDFRSFLSNLTLANHEPIPDVWFEEYFQNQFSCRLSSSTKMQKQYAKECKGDETVHADDVVQDPFVFHTILSINSIAHGLDSYIRKQCVNAETLEDCEIIQAELLLEILQQAHLSLNSSYDQEINANGKAYGYHIWNYRQLGSDYGFVSAGKWENSVLSLQKSNIEFKIGSYPPNSLCNSGICLDVCSSQSPVYAAMGLPRPLPLDYNFRTVYGMVASSLSLLGIITVMVTMIYFMTSFPAAAGSSLLSYFILIGCVMIYSVNFAFIFQPTAGTCAVRRLLMGIGYAMVFASMLVKVIYIWKTINYSDSSSSISRPSGFLILTVILVMVQVILSSVWLILFPPTVDLHGNVWRCTPSDKFESDLVISFVYVMILMAATILFCMETWHSEENSRETRWILLASLFTSFCWIIWTVVATQSPVAFRDPAIVIGNIVCTTCILSFLYARKLNIYSQLTKDVRDLEIRSHYTAATSLYDASLSAAQKTNSTNTVYPTDVDNFTAAIPGRQFVGDQEVSFRTVTLPPSTPSSRSAGSKRRSRASSRRSVGVSVSDDLPEDLNFDVFESSEEEYAIDAHPLSDDDDDLSLSKARQPSIRRVGSRQMLVFLTDGNSIGEVSRI